MPLSRSAAVIAAALIVLGTTACRSDNPQPTPSSSSAPGQLPEVPAPGDQPVSLQFGDKLRSFVVHAPPAYDGKSALPLVVAMHYYPGDSTGIATTSALNAKADKENFLVVYPQGHAGGYNALICCGSEDDVGFIKTIIERMVSKWKADPKRVYATGISNG
ncbi:MAG TPA: polyhydroxybutyrate depolymerase, partial [Micromonosporaceae bacterium]|nr:polyhydroxybutyrate depolymerase [Micromonosporaceae bacterium]